MKKIIVATVASVLLVLSAVASADPVSMVYSCTLNDGKTKEDALAVNAKWLKWARATAGTDAITSSYVSTVVGDLGGFMWVDTYPDLAAWAKVNGADLETEQPEIAAAFDELETCSKNRVYSATETVPAK